MAKLYSNENFPLPVVTTLRLRGHDVLTIQETGHANRRMPDDAVLEFATGNGRAVLTLNRKHFVRLHNMKENHGGIVACTYDPDFDALATRIHAALITLPDLHSRLLRVNRAS